MIQTPTVVIKTNNPSPGQQISTYPGQQISTYPGQQTSTYQEQHNLTSYPINQPAVDPNSNSQTVEYSLNPQSQQPPIYQP